MSKAEKQLIEVLEQLTHAIEANTAATRLLAATIAAPEAGEETAESSAMLAEDRLILEPEAEAQPDM